MSRPSSGPPADQAGGIITGWLLQLLVFFAVLAFVAYETISVVITTVSLDDVAADVARSARDEYRVSRAVDAATAAANRTAEARDARVTGVTEHDGALVVELERDAPTLVIHRIGFLEHLTEVNSTARITWASS